MSRGAANLAACRAAYLERLAWCQREHINPVTGKWDMAAAADAASAAGRPPLAPILTGAAADEVMKATYRRNGRQDEGN